jgi:uncharacterized protein
MSNQTVLVRILLLLIVTTAIVAGRFSRTSVSSAQESSAQRPEIRFVEAVSRGDVEAVNAALNAGIDPNIRDDKDGEKSTVLMIAAFAGHLKVTELLLNRGADVEAKTPHGRTALMWAALGAHTDVTSALLAKGADVNAVDDNNATALFLAIQGNGPDTVRLLLKTGARADILPKEAGSLWRVIFHSRCDQCVAALLDGGIDVNGKDRFGQTPLMLAVDSARTSAAKLLLDKGADVHVRDSQYRTALTRARKKQDQSMIKLLIEYGADSPDTKKRSWP